MSYHLTSATAAGLALLATLTVVLTAAHSSSTPHTFMTTTASTTTTTTGPSMTMMGRAPRPVTKRSTALNAASWGPEATGIIPGPSSLSWDGATSSTTEDRQRLRSAILRSLLAVPFVLLASWSMPRPTRKVALATVTGQTTEATEGGNPNANNNTNGGGGGGDAEYVFGCLMAEIPKGTRKLLNLRGANILLFWYRNELYAIENRSPAEGAFNQGFEQARFTQDYGILCPSTETEFNLKTGEVTNWLPNNSVLRFLTPPCPPLEVFPVRVDGDEVKVLVPAEERSYFDGGARSSFERNNVFGIEPRMYLDDGTYIDEMGTTQKSAPNPTTIIVSTIAAAIVAVAGTATCLYFESLPALALFWITGFAIAAKVVVDYTDDAFGDNTTNNQS